MDVGILVDKTLVGLAVGIVVGFRDGITVGPVEDIAELGALESS